MSIAVITGSAGLIGAEAARLFTARFDIVGIDNDMRRHFFGDDASTRWARDVPKPTCPATGTSMRTFATKQPWASCSRAMASRIAVVIHTAAQPSHDWAARDPLTDFSVNANGTLLLLRRRGKHVPRGRRSSFCHTNKVYGDTPNSSAAGRAGDALGGAIRPIRIAEHGIDETDEPSIALDALACSARRRWRPT